jgi:hypothetical protein
LFTQTGKKTDPFFASVRFFCQYPEKIGQIKIGKILSVRPIFSVLEKLDGCKKIGRMKKMNQFFACLCERSLRIFLLVLVVLLQSICTTEELVA